MLDQHTEFHFESLIVSELTTERLGWVEGDAAGYDAQLGLYPADLIAHLRETQGKKWDRLVALAGTKSTAEARILQRAAAELDRRGTIAVLRDGFLEGQQQWRPFQPSPAHQLDPTTDDLFRANICRVVRQVRHEPGKRDALDLVLFVNGIPTATAELKNRLTGQNFEHAKHQYCKDRDPANVLLGRRAFVHFAADAEEAWMTTRLAGARTWFLPFNQGSEGAGNAGGKGNPVSPDGHATSYLWEQVWARDRWLELIQKFVHVEPPSDDAPKGTPSTVVFPRFHQLDVVRQASTSARLHGPGRNYLIQHSAGSGKTKEIAWLAHELSALHTAEGEKVFDKVVVITDRRVLDRQLQTQIEQFEQVDGVVRSITGSSKDLADALSSRAAKIVVTTLQKFPFLLDKLDEDADLKSGRYAVIVDEAHSSQTGEAAAKLKEGIGSVTVADLDLDEDDGTPVELLTRLASRRPQPNLSFFAFTATPKGKTLTLFGDRENPTDPTSNSRAFHVYSMRQAIEEGFIVDVLRNVTTYGQLYELETAAGNMEVDRSKASRKIAQYARLHPYVKDQKAEVVIEHYRRIVRPLLGGTAKAMVVCSSREEAVQWKLALDAYITRAKVGEEVKVLAAFSGTVKISHPEAPNRGSEWTEPQINAPENRGRALPESELPTVFDRKQFGILVVAEKYQTGFDQPKLCGMYVDKRLSGINAVQTLSRLNRAAAGKRDVYVLDFENSVEDLRAAFEPYYQATEALPVDPLELDNALQTLNDLRVILPADIDEFQRAMLKGAEMAAGTEKDRDRVNALFSVATNVPYERARALRGDEDEPTEAYDAFIDAATRFQRYYAFLSGIVPWVAPSTHVLYELARFLLPRLRDEAPPPLEPLPLKLKRFGLWEIGTERVRLGAEEPEPLRGFDAGGGRTAEIQKNALEELVELFNERYRQAVSSDAEVADVAGTVLKLMGDSISEEDSGRLVAQARSSDRDDFVRGREDDVVRVALESSTDLADQNAFLRTLVEDEDLLRRTATVLYGAIWDAHRESAPGDAGAA